MDWLSAAYGIPYRCLLPLGLENLLVSGRCISVTHEALASTRVMVQCMEIGQAAGTAAALSIRQSCTPRQLDPTLLCRTLETREFSYRTVYRSARSRIMPKKPLLYEKVLEYIKLKIADGTYSPGDRLPPVTTLAEELGVAVSTVREGMRALAMLGLISVKQGHGTFIPTRFTWRRTRSNPFGLPRMPRWRHCSKFV